MRKLISAATALAAAFLLTCLGATSASAAEVPEFGPEDGYTVTTESYPLISGQDPIEVIYADTAPTTGISPMDVWGTSYATSTEGLFYIYTGRAKAAGNVYSGLRIIKVCIWYSYPGGTPSPTVCSSATSNGAAWSPGSEATATFVDHPSAGWPPSTFHIQTTRINPGIF